MRLLEGLRKRKQGGGNVREIPQVFRMCPEAHGSGRTAGRDFPRGIKKRSFRGKKRGYDEMKK